MIYSTIESEVFGLNVYRTTNLIDNYSIIDLKKYINKKEIDVIRVNSNKSQEEIISFFEHTDIPFQIVNHSYKYHVNLEEINCIEIPNIENITCQQVSSDAERNMFLEQLLYAFREDPIGFYRVNLLADITTKEKELIVLYKYYENKYYNKKCDFCFILDDGEYFFYNIEEQYDDDLMMNHMAAIFEGLQNKGYFFKGVYFLILYYKSKGYKVFEVGARGDNLYSQRVFQKLGFQLVKSELIYYLCPLINYNSKL